MVVLGIICLAAGCFLLGFSAGGCYMYRKACQSITVEHNTIGDGDFVVGDKYVSHQRRE